MKVVILAGGLGTRISEESQFKPKPMVELGGMPILWHIMKLYDYYGFRDFIICAGYKQHVIKAYFADYFLHTSDITCDFTNGTNEMTIHRSTSERWKVTVVDTGLNTMTGGRLKRVQDYIGEHGSVRSFREKNASDGASINAGFMVFQPEIFQYLQNDTTILETEPLEKLAEEGHLMSYQHSGFWQCMDTVREKELLEKLWAGGQAPWKVWR